MSGGRGYAAFLRFMLLVLKLMLECFAVVTVSMPVHVRQVSSILLSALILQKSGLLKLQLYFPHIKPFAVFSLYLCFMISSPAFA
jgi:hypothetical protein